MISEFNKTSQIVLLSLFAIYLYGQLHHQHELQRSYSKDLFKFVKISPNLFSVSFKTNCAKSSILSFSQFFDRFHSVLYNGFLQVHVICDYFVIDKSSGTSLTNVTKDQYMSYDGSTTHLCRKVCFHQNLS